MQHPLTHLNGLRVLQHLHKIGVDNPLEKLVLGSAWRHHGALDLSEKIARNENRGYLRDTVVKTFGSIYNEFLPTKIRNIQENGVREAHEVPMRQGGAPYRGGAASSLVGASCPFRTTSFFLKSLNNPKLIKIAIRVVLESVYLPYHVPMPFRGLEHSGKCLLCIPRGLWFQ